MALIWIARLIAEVIGFAVLGIITALLVAALVSAVHDFIRSRNLKYDLYWYDDVGRWNRRWRKRRRNADGASDQPKPDLTDRQPATVQASGRVPAP